MGECAAIYCAVTIRITLLSNNQNNAMKKKTQIGEKFHFHLQSENITLVDEAIAYYNTHDLKDNDEWLYDEKTGLPIFLDTNILLDLYRTSTRRRNEFLKFKDLRTQYVENKKSINTKFEFDINAISTTLKYIDENSNNRHKEFEIGYNHYDDEYKYDCNSSLILDIIRDHEDELLKKVFVKIEDCPEWTREILYNKRKEQLEEEKKKQKKLEFKRKLFPWIK